MAASAANNVTRKYFASTLIQIAGRNVASPSQGAMVWLQGRVLRVVKPSHGDMYYLCDDGTATFVVVVFSASGAEGSTEATDFVECQQGETAHVVGAWKVLSRPAEELGRLSEALAADPSPVGNMLQRTVLAGAAVLMVSAQYLSPVRTVLPAKTEAQWNLYLLHQDLLLSGMQ